MNKVRLIAQALSPIVLNEERQSANATTLPYIPGSTLRGALAAAYLRQGGKAADPNFVAMFLAEPIAFPDLLPAETPEDCPRSFPLSAHSCKRREGFSQPEEGHGVKDMLWAITSSRLGQAAAKPDDWRCSRCGQDLKPLTGFWNGILAEPKTTKPSYTYNKFTGIDRLTGTVAQSIFYTSRSIDEVRGRGEANGLRKPQLFVGETWVPAGKIEILQDLLQEPVFVGADRTRGFGEIALQVKPGLAETPAYESWSKKFSQKAGLPEEGFYAAVLLASHAILVDRFLRPTPDFPDVDGDELRSVTRVLRPVRIRGWQSAWGLPKPDETGVRMGSVYLLHYSGANPLAFFERLETWRRQGIGLRREEGFGSVVIDDPLHIFEEVKA